MKKSKKVIPVAKKGRGRPSKKDQLPQYSYIDQSEIDAIKIGEIVKCKFYNYDDDLTSLITAYGRVESNNNDRMMIATTFINGERNRGIDTHHRLIHSIEVLS